MRRVYTRYGVARNDRYTERQLKILSEEIDSSEVQTAELEKLLEKAESIGDERSIQQIQRLYEKKRFESKPHAWDSWTVEDAQRILQELTPWDRSCLTKQE